MSDIDSGSGTASPAPSSTGATPATQGTGDSGSVSQVQGSADSGSSGEPPRERWNDILENARQKTRREVEQEYKTRYGGYDEFERDPLSAVTNWIDQASQHSLVGETVRRAILERAQRWQQPQQAKPIGDAPQPDVPVVDENGRVVKQTYSADQLGKLYEWREQQLIAKLEERFGPLEESNAQRAEREEYQAIQQQADTNANHTLSSLRQNPYFRDNEARIKQVFAEHPEFGENVHQAFSHVLVHDILPTLSTAERKTAVEALTGKGAGTTVSPNGTQTRAPKFKSYKAAAEYYEAHPDEAAAMANRDGS